ncbi:hypothetical protein [Acetobacterium bakii]|uniref:Uncharacterized protein n=1 Tax=Acetobacterium bakii TaxID=52689 RepID=A0A0L6U136_9FIRM|nr:hypothetical protein [Acetobacterium bakii]KNZ41515.1 hypothetical protein AKG39_11000 [Acetobacterium bakii]
MENKYTKKYVKVIAEFEEDGRIIPLRIFWEDGRVFEIDRILDVRPGVSRKVGGQGIRYLCRILNKEVCLFYEEPRWYVESK